MRGTYQQLQSLIRAIHKDGPTPDHLKNAVLLLIDEVIHLQRELDRVNIMAQRAEHQSRGIYRR